MNDDKKKKLRNKGYEVEDTPTFLGLQPDEVDRILTMIEEAKMRWLIDKYS